MLCLPGRFLINSAIGTDCDGTTFPAKISHIFSFINLLLKFRIFTLRVKNLEIDSSYYWNADIFVDISSQRIVDVDYKAIIVLRRITLTHV